MIKSAVLFVTFAIGLIGVGVYAASTLYVISPTTLANKFQTTYAPDGDIPDTVCAAVRPFVCEI